MIRAMAPSLGPEQFRWVRSRGDQCRADREHVGSAESHAGQRDEEPDGTTGTGTAPRLTAKTRHVT